MRVSVVVMCALVGCEPGEESLESLRAKDEETRQQIEALQAQVAALEAELEGQEGRVTAVEADVGTLEAAVEALEDTATGEMLVALSDFDARLTAVEDAGYVDADWVLAQGYATGSDLLALEADVNANASTLVSQRTLIDTTTATSEANAAAIGAHALVLGQHATSITANTDGIAAGQQAQAGLSSSLDGLSISVADLDEDLAAVEGTMSTVDVVALDQTVTGQADTLAQHGLRLDGHDTALTGQADAVAVLDGRLDLAEADLVDHRAAIDANAEAIGTPRTVQRVVGYQHDGGDGGWLGGRALTFLKTRDDTSVRVTWSDNRRGIGYIYGRWEIYFNGKRCTSPGPVQFFHHSIATSDYNDNHYTATFVGYCDGIEDLPEMTAGSYEIAVQLHHLGGRNTDWFVGWGYAGQATQFVLEAEEVL